MRSRIVAVGLSVLAWSAGPAAQTAGTAEKLNGYAEFRHNDVLIVDGQRVVASRATRFKGPLGRSLAAIPLGSEMQVKGVRLADGAVMATEVEAKPNGTALFEADVRQATDEVEATWLKEGVMFEPKSDGGREVIGKTRDEGPDVDRVRRIMDRLSPPYLDRQAIRVHVVETKEWNAAAMGNGAVWVYTGLINDMSDDELAIILGHELAHYTHEHSRRAAKQSMWTQILGLGAVAAAGTIDNDAARTSAQVAALLSMTAFSSGYSRDHEDQADRVGLRYTYEGGYDVRQGPVLWARFRDKYGETDVVTNFFVGSHSRPSDRIRNIERELALNYR
jgi:Zn-dependent protease with chaperone function